MNSSFVYSALEQARGAILKKINKVPLLSTREKPPLAAWPVIQFPSQNRTNVSRLRLTLGGEIQKIK